MLGCLPTGGKRATVRGITRRERELPSPVELAMVRSARSSLPPMTFKFHCTCGQKVSATSDMIGTRATCPRCGASVKVPKPPEEPSGTTEDKASAASKKEETPKSPPVTPPAEPAPKAKPEPPAVSKEAPEAAPASAPTPLKIVARPVGFLWAIALGFAVPTIAAAAFLGWSNADRIPKTAWFALVAIAIGLPLGAVLLRQFVRLLLRFDLGFSESLPVTLLAASLTALSLIPAGLSLAGKIPPEPAARLLPITIGAAIFLTMAAYGFLIRNALGRPVGMARGALACLLQSVSIGIFFAAVFGAARQFVFHG